MTIFPFLDGFSISEKWGSPDKMNGLILLLLDKIRYIYRHKYDTEASFHIHCGYQETGHVSKSEHAHELVDNKKIGNAVDFHIDSKLSYGKQVEAMQIILLTLQVSDVVGFGIYPDWNTPGFHIDVRGYKARWGRLGANQYVTFAEAIGKITTREGKSENA